MRIVLFLLGLGLSLDGLYCGYTGSMGLGEAMIVTAGIVFILWAVFYEAFRDKKFLRVLRDIFVFMMIVFVVYSGAVFVIGRMDNSSWREDYAIVLGAGLDDDRPTAVLEKRLDKAVEFANRNPESSIIVSGAQGKDENTSEAMAMGNYLISSGVSDGKILLEETATSTYENFAASREAVADGTVVFITNEYHVLRSALMAQLNGVNATHIAAPTPLAELPCCLAREIVAQLASIRYYIGF